MTPSETQDHIRRLFHEERLRERHRPSGPSAVASPVRLPLLRGNGNLNNGNLNGGPHDGHEPVSSDGHHASLAPETGTHDAGEDAETIEVALPQRETPPDLAPDEESMLLDAYWASFGDAETRAALRDERTREAVMEVVLGHDDRQQITRTDLYPWRCIASLLITAGDGSRWIGTAWLASPRLLVTAGHCVYIHSRGGWVRQIEVIPGRHSSNHPFGSCTAVDFRSVSGWTQGNDREFDYGAILLPETCRLGDRLGWFGIDVRDDDMNGLAVNISGYPGDKPAGTQWFHSNQITDTDARIVTYDVDTAGGQSGAPVWVYKPDRGRFAVGIHTNGSLAGNSATRITSDVFANLNAWRDAVA